MARHTSGTGSGLFVTVLTCAALAVVGFFAYQASAVEDRPGGAASPPTESPSAESPSPDGGDEGGAAAAQPALPAESGQGRRVVYALGEQRVWLVDRAADGTGEAVTETFEVFPSSVSPPAGEYAVTSRWEEGTGSDGVSIEHSVIFHEAADGTVFGFSAALDGSTPDPDAQLRTGAIRETRAAGEAMWEFATDGVTVVVVP